VKARVAGSVISLACCREPALDRARGLFGNPGRRERRVNADDQRGAGSEREGGRRQDAIFRQPARIPQGSREIATTSAALAVIGIEPLLGTSASQARVPTSGVPKPRRGPSYVSNRRKERMPP